MNILDLKGENALITGAGQGVGRQVALHFAAHNAGTVYVNDFSAERAERASSKKSKRPAAAPKRSRATSPTSPRCRQSSNRSTSSCSSTTPATPAPIRRKSAAANSGSRRRSNGRRGSA